MGGSRGPRVLQGALALVVMCHNLQALQRLIQGRPPPQACGTPRMLKGTTTRTAPAVGCESSPQPSLPQALTRAMGIPPLDTASLQPTLPAPYTLRTPIRHHRSPGETSCESEILGRPSNRRRPLITTVERIRLSTAVLELASWTHLDRAPVTYFPGRSSRSRVDLLSHQRRNTGGAPLPARRMRGPTSSRCSGRTLESFSFTRKERTYMNST